MAGACPYKLIVYGENALFLWNLLLFTRAQKGQTGNIVVMRREGSAGVVNFVTPGRGSCAIWLFLWNLFLFSRAWRGQGECTGMMIREGSAGVVDFVTPGAGVFCLGVTEWVIY